ncbi:hypothetical protein HCN44_002884 [Aphidius gifuensis]|uniref:Uncharacterized protein n=1 Tax=Aphidius gifuensis TaxID=684658 RepID=A0A835CPJ8_APHGI|nr:hypoxia-inducible factor 1-alpha isoform X2 [Aphidius gifuensis]KAF7991322.1 hypothetical protein HCN44_002884 [Aphidius gifuensis]
MESKKKPKERRRSNEKRKEKSRDAARCRRSKETDIFGELAAALPISTDQAANLDKASIMRLAIAYLKVRSVIDESAIEPVVETNTVSKMSSLFPDALNGFMLVLSSNGDMVYLSENVTEYLGVSQIELMGQSVFEYSHPCDHAEIRECLSIKTSDINEKPPCNFFLRLKCTLTNKGRKVNLKSASYKVIHCIGRPMMIKEATQSNDTTDLPSSESSGSVTCSEDSQDCSDNVNVNRQTTGVCLVVVGCPIPHPSNIEVPLGHDTILSKHNLNMKFTYVDERLSEYLGWSNNDLVGKSVFEFYHALDNSALDKSLKSLFSKGQCETMAYRFLNKTGGFVWVVTQATLIRCTKQQKPLSVVCVNYILSGVECKDEIYSIRQLEATNDKQLITSNENNNNIEDTNIENINPKIISEKRITRPCSVTASIFKDRVPDKKLSNDNTTTITTTTNVDDKKDNKRSSNCQNQDKLVADYDTTILRNRSGGNRPQAVTRNIFCQDNPLSGRPQTTTASIFAPRTEDMSKGFLTFSEDQPGLTMLKDEPEDLTHLAPTPGDVCVPLEDTPFISDMLDEFILGNEVYCPLLSPSLPPELNDDVDLINDDNIKNTNNNTTTTTTATTIVDGDPFFYADNDSSTNCCLSNSDDLLTPIIDKSPEQHSIDSLYSHDDNSNGIGSGISDDDMLMLSINDVIADEELALRAPYIPMSDQDEALQLLISDDMVMWGPTQTSEKKSKWDNNDDDVDVDDTKKFNESSLAKLLKGTSDDIDKRTIENYIVDPVQVLGQNCKKGTNKRNHGTMLSTNESDKKRIRYQDTTKQPSPIVSNDIYSINMPTILTATTTTNGQIDRLTILNDDKINNNDDELRMGGNKMLLEQLMEQCHERITIKTPIDKRNERNNRQEEKEDDDDGGGGGGDDAGGIKYQHDDAKRQSNSVLMNLLVSGCDKTCVELPRNYSPLKISTDDPFVDQDAPLSSPYLSNMIINQDSQCIKNIEDLTSSLLINNSPFIDDDDFNYNINTEPLSPGSELLQVLGQ